MAVLIEKQRRKRFPRSNRTEQDQPFVIRAESIGLPDGTIDCGDGVYCLVTLQPDLEIYETWTVRPAPVVH